MNRKLLKEINEVRNFPKNTCPASRHAFLLGEVLLKGKIPGMIEGDPEHCGESILITVRELWKLRTKYE